MINDKPFIEQFIIWATPKNNIPLTLENASKLVLALVEKLSLTVMNTSYYEFPQQGLTYVAILSQSHLVIHTWPEANMVRVDLATCQLIDEIKLRDSVLDIFEDVTSLTKVSA